MLGRPGRPAAGAPSNSLSLPSSPDDRNNAGAGSRELAEVSNSQEFDGTASAPPDGRPLSRLRVTKRMGNQQNSKGGSEGQGAFLAVWPPNPTPLVLVRFAKAVFL